MTAVSIEEKAAAYDALLAVIDNLTATIDKQAEQIEALTAQIQELTEKLNQRKRNSNNSSKPPSSDGYEKPKPKSLRGPSGKSPGGQKGHNGNSLKIDMEPDTIVPHYPEQCKSCPLNGVCKGKEKDTRYEVDVELKRTVTCHRQMEMACPLHNGQTICGKFPSHVTGTKQYGPNLQAFCVSLSMVGAVGLDRIKSLLNAFFQINPSTGTLQSFNSKCAAKIKDANEAIFDRMTRLSVLHSDETGIRVNGKLAWLHCYCDGSWAFYAHHKKRGSDAMDDIGFLPFLSNVVLVHDFWKPYFQYRAILHSMCCAHLERELVYAYETTDQEWAVNLRKLLVEMNAEKVKLQHEGHTGFTEQELRNYFSRYDEYVTTGLNENPAPQKKPGRGRPKKGKIRALLERFQDYKAEILRFATNWEVPFTNNEAERDIRCAKVKVKVAGCFRSNQGADDYAAIMTYTKTAKKHRVDFFEAIRQAFMGNSLALVQSWA